MPAMPHSIPPPACMLDAAQPFAGNTVKLYHEFLTSGPDGDLKKTAGRRGLAAFGCPAHFKRRFCS